MKVLLALLLCSFAALIQSSPQLINLRHPEFNEHQLHRLSQRPRFIARPGNVIVHFDHSHDIQQLQYVLQDGRLATLYQRALQHPANSRLPVQVRANQLVQRRDENSNSVSTQTVDHSQTIQVVDSHSQPVSNLVGDHVTVELSDQSKASTESSTSHVDPTDDKLDVLATIAVDAIQLGAQTGGAKLRKVGNLVLDKLKSKVNAKLHELPKIIEAKLQAKSTVGQMFIEQKSEKANLMNQQKVELAQQKNQQLNAANSAKFESSSRSAPEMG